MTEKMIISALCAFVATVVVGYAIIPLLRKLKAKQTILCYLKEHYCKSGTPTMGGLFFVPVGIIVYFLFALGEKTIGLISAIITLCYLIVGFLDDFIKVKFCKNEGLTPTQKMLFQVSVATISCIFAYRMGLTKVYVPFTDKLIDIGFWSIPLAIFVFLATTNCVNLTDGLDGLASGVSSVCFLFSAILIVLQTTKFQNYYVVASEYRNISLLLICMAASCCGFLIFNTFKASVFMGDTGSLALGGLFASTMIFSGNVLYIPIIGIMFVISGISVIMQVCYFKLTKRRIFLMAPLHHHFQHKGISESKIVFGYVAVTAVVSSLVIIVFM